MALSCSSVRAAVAIFLLGLLGSLAVAQQGHPVWSEVEVDLGADGRSSVTYMVRYQVTGDLHGFYFSGPQIDRLEPVWDDGWGRATTSAGAEYGLVRGRRGGRQTIELAGGAGVTTGFVDFRFRFATDFARHGFLARTRDAEGLDLATFHWAPSTWDHALEHYTVRVRYPVQVAGDPRGEEFLERVHFRTEEFMNSRYRIDYRQTDDGRFEVLLHAEDLPTDASFDIQQYVLASIFDPAAWQGAATGSGPAAPRSARSQQRSATNERLWAAAIGAIILLAFWFAFRRKHGEVRDALARIDDVSWAKVDWTPPQIELSTFRKPGKVCMDLTPVEVGFFLEIPYRRILSVMLQRLLQAGFLEVIRDEPLLVKVLERHPRDLAKLEDYEHAMVKAAADDGAFSKRELEELLDLVVEGIQKKSWDCDIEATKAHWREQIGPVWEQRARDGHEAPEQDAERRYIERHHGWYHWYYWQHGYHDYDASLRPDRFARAIDVGVDHVSYEAFLSDAVPTNVCHSACHSACHSGGSF